MRYFHCAQMNRMTAGACHLPRSATALAVRQWDIVFRFEQVTRLDPSVVVRARVGVNKQQPCSVQSTNPGARFFVEFTNAGYHVNGAMED